jgi:hypothetical protein
MRSLIGAALVIALGLVSLPASAEQFVQARCEHRDHLRQWRGPRHSDAGTQQAFRDADEHNRHHRGHLARVLVVAHE